MRDRTRENRENRPAPAETEYPETRPLEDPLARALQPDSVKTPPTPEAPLGPALKAAEPIRSAGDSVPPTAVELARGSDAQRIIEAGRSGSFEGPPEMAALEERLRNASDG